MPKDEDFTAPKKERFVSTKKMINDEEGMGRIFKYGGMFIVLIGWNVLESFTRFIPSAIWVFIISGLLDALANCLVVIFSAKIRGKNAWIWATIISGWNILSLLSHMLPINLWILIENILDPILNILFLIFAPMILFDKNAPSAANAPAPKSVDRTTVVASKPDTVSSRPATAAVRPETVTEAKKDTTTETTGINLATDTISENALERDTLKIVAELTQTNRILAEQIAKKEEGGSSDAKLSSGNGGQKDAG